MKISTRHLRRIIREEAKSTKKYDEDSALKGDQEELPDALQKGIIDKTVEEREEEEKKDESRKLRLTVGQLRRIIREAEQLELPLPSGPSEPEYGEFARTPEVQAMLQAAGFNPDGSFGMDGYPGPGDWQMYSPETMEDAEGWVDAAIEMNDALRKAEVALDRGEFQDGESAWSKIVYPVQRKWGKHGAADTEGREVAAWWLEKQGYEW
jgi:hypothetical protein